MDFDVFLFQRAPQKWGNFRKASGFPCTYIAPILTGFCKQSELPRGNKTRNIMNFLSQVDVLNNLSPTYTAINVRSFVIFRFRYWYSPETVALIMLRRGEGGNGMDKKRTLRELCDAILNLPAISISEYWIFSREKRKKRRNTSGAWNSSV